MDDRNPFKRPRPAPTGKLQRPAPKVGSQGLPAQEKPFVVRLDPSAAPGEFNFIVDGPEALSKTVPAQGLSADASGSIPPELYRAVDEVMAFIYNLDQQFESKRKPKK